MIIASSVVLVNIGMVMTMIVIIIGDYMCKIPESISVTLNHIMLNHVKSRCSVVESYFSLVSILHGTTFTRYVCHAFVR
jgi:hypothetical protein